MRTRARSWSIPIMPGCWSRREPVHRRRFKIQTSRSSRRSLSRLARRSSSALFAPEGGPSACPSSPVPGERWVRAEWAEQRGCALRLDHALPIFQVNILIVRCPSLVHGKYLGWKTAMSVAITGLRYIPRERASCSTERASLPSRYFSVGFPSHRLPITLASSSPSLTAIPLTSCTSNTLNASV